MSTILIVPQGITQLYTDAVVNAANESLWAGGGVCGVIFDNANYDELTGECRKIGHCDTGSAVITPACGFPNARYIIHAVGPVWNGGTRQEPQKLYGCYKASLELAKKNNCTSIGFPLISSGIFGYPIEGAWRKALQACQDFISENPTYEILIKFGVPNADIRKTGFAVMKDLGIESTYEGSFC